MKKTHVIIECLLVVVCLFSSNIGLCQETGVQVVRQIIIESDFVRNIPQASIDSFCDGIEKIETDSSVRVTYPQMSTWRKNMFRQSVEHRQF